MSLTPTPPVFQRPANQTDTAAELVKYASYTKKGTSEVCWTRWASAKNDFEIVQDQSVKYLLKFDNNFAKKHLVTLSKKELATEAEAAKLDQTNAPEENIKAAQETLLDRKILKTLAVRAHEDPCICGHACLNDAAQGIKGHTNKGKGKCNVAGCTCTKYKSSYKPNRQAAGKPTPDPLKGKAAGTSSCLVLNWIPLSEFQTVVSKAIKAADADGKLAVGSQKMLKWDFGTGRAGAIRVAKKGEIVDVTKTSMEVEAKKMANDPTKFAATWQVLHWANEA